MDQLRGGFMPGLLGNGGGAGAGGGFPASSLDLDFTAGTSVGSQLTTVRATTAFADDTAGVWTNFNVNFPRLTDKGLLVEEARTNSIRNNSMTGAAAGTPGTAPTNWVVSLGTTALTQQITGTGTENGIDYIEVRLSGTSAAGSIVVQFEQGTQIVAASGETWTSSVFVRLAAGTLTGVTTTQITMAENTSGGAFVAGANTTQSAPTATWARYAVTRLLSGGGTVARIVHSLGLVISAGAAVDITLRLGWPQLELGAFVTSPIRTTTTAATRAADAVSVAGFTPNAAVYSLAGEYMAPSNPVTGATAMVVCADDGTANNRDFLAINQSALKTASTNSFVAAASQGRVDASPSFVAGTIIRAAMALANGDRAITSGGVAVTASAVGARPASLTTLRLGNDSGAVGPLNGYLRRVVYWPSRLTNAQLQLVTG